MSCEAAFGNSRIPVSEWRQREHPYKERFPVDGHSGVQKSIKTVLMPTVLHGRFLYGLKKMRVRACL